MPPSPPPRRIERSYRDPLELLWLGCAARIGLKVERSDAAYAATDGAGVLRIGGRAVLDPDDCLAQMIFHELCHSLVEGEDSFGRADWGLDNTSDRDAVREEACLRTQATLATRHGLREVLAPTTDYRAYWDALPAEVLADRADRAVPAAILAVRRAGLPPWAPHLDRALTATRVILAAAAPLSPAGDTSLVAVLAAARPPHPTGLPGAAASAARCGTCAWAGDGTCRQAGTAVDPSWAACERWEPAVDCRACGACCRAAYDSVTIEADDPVRQRHPELVVARATYLELRRAGDRCAALHGGDGAPFSCRIYDARPRPCREFEENSDNCLTARRRLGLSL